MSIGAIAKIVSTTAAATPASRPEPVASGTSQVPSPPQVDRQPALATPPEATVTTLSDAALAQQAADAQAALDASQAARDAAVVATTSVMTAAVYRDWAAGAPAGGDGAVQEALNALDEASRENLRAAAAALSTLQDQAAREQEAVDEAGALAVQQRDATLLFAMNAEIRLAYGALPSPGTGDPVLREPGQVDVIA
jgi:hypothetical protein